MKAYSICFTRISSNKVRVDVASSSELNSNSLIGLIEILVWKIKNERKFLQKY